VAQSGGLLELKRFWQAIQDRWCDRLKPGCLIDLERDRPTQMACPLLEWFLKPENSWSLNVAVVGKHEDASQQHFKGVDLESQPQ
jgi:hypothetical protein